MAGPITWQNVGQANFGDTANFMQLANQQANQAFTNASTRAKDIETKAISRNTNSLLSKLGSIQDEDTLNAFKNTIDLNDPNIDSNAIVNAFGEQSKNILNRNQTLLDMDATQQNINASVAGVALNERQFTETQTQNKFQNDLSLKQDKRAQASTVISDRAANLGIQQAEQQIADEKLLKTIEQENSATALSMLKGDITPGRGIAQVIQNAANKGRISVGLAEATKLVEQLAETSKLNPAQTKELTQATGRITSKLTELNNTLTAAKTNLVKTKYNGNEPKPPIGIDEQIETNSTLTDSINSFVQDVSKIDPNASELFVNQIQSHADGTSNVGYQGLVRQANNNRSELYEFYRNELKRQNVPDASNATIDPALLKAGLKGVSPVGNFFDGINLKDLARVMAATQKERKTYEDYQKDYAQTVKPIENEIIRINEQSARVIDELQSKFTGNNQKFIAESLGGNPNNINSGSGDGIQSVEDFLKPR